MISTETLIASFLYRAIGETVVDAEFRFLHIVFEITVAIIETSLGALHRRNSTHITGIASADLVVDDCIQIAVSIFESWNIDEFHLCNFIRLQSQYILHASLDIVDAYLHISAL